MIHAIGIIFFTIIYILLSFSSMDINACQIDEKKWQCPVEQCKKILSRKQTLIEHVISFHSTLHLGNLFDLMCEQ